MQVVGPSTFRSFLPPQRYQVMVTNRGNVDAIAVPLYISIRQRQWVLGSCLPIGEPRSAQVEGGVTQDMPRLGQLDIQLV